MDIKTILSKPLPVIWYRLVQLIKLKYYFRIHFWEKIEKKVTKQFGTHSNNFHKKESKLFTQKSKINFASSSSVEKAEEIINGSISIFDVTYKMALPFVWNVDWRHQKTWENKYYKMYSFYEKEKRTPYDVKFPWELSRLSFLIPVSRAYNSTEDSKYLDFINDTLASWKNKNPIAYSVNWYPMEVSVRTLNLIQLRELLLHSKDTDKTIQLLNEILVFHGVFLWRNIEYTDVRGNHYSANLTALLLLGSTYKSIYKESKKWFKYAINKTEREFHLQFITDGVNFEKSIPYHRLVVEFYFISFLVMKRLNVSVSKRTINLFHKACIFIKDYTKPNQLTPIIGDNDSASVFQNDEVTLNNHSNILQLASVFLTDETLNISSVVFNSTNDIFGEIQLKEREINTKTEHFFYKEGGFFIAKNREDYFITDVGEVGMKGRGGHGHNDLFSFELMYDNVDLIVDSGCFTYTGDLTLKNQMKSSEYHNGLMIDGKEIAPLIGDWGISNSSVPYDVIIEDLDKKCRIFGKHKGYNKLEDSAIHQRIFEINKSNHTVLCEDNIICKGDHQVTRSIHFNSDVTLKIDNNFIAISNKEKGYKMFFDKFSKPEILTYNLSFNYGTKETANKIVLTTNINKRTTLFFNIEKESKDEQA